MGRARTASCEARCGWAAAALLVIGSAINRNELKQARGTAWERLMEGSQKPKYIKYTAHKIPAGKGIRHWGEWVQLWWFRFGIETCACEMEPAEQAAFCKPRPAGARNRPL